MTERERNLQRQEDKRLMMEAMNSGLMAPYEEPVPPPKHSTAPADEPLGDQGDFEPCNFFFYGTLMDPQVLTTVLKLDGVPQLQEAWIEGFEMKMWNGIYPVVLPTDGGSGSTPQSRIRGKAWQATTMDQCLRLQLYETSAYEPTDCSIRLDHGEPVKGLVFKWARDPTDGELVEGCFDLDHWERTHKPILF
jgi:hypothetical protein